MARARPAAGGGRWVDVAPERLSRWLENFATRHGDTTAGDGATDDGAAEGGAAGPSPPVPGAVVVTGADGAVAVLYPPPGAAGAARPDDLDAFVADACAPRRLGLVLARSGAAAVGVADGSVLSASKVDSWYVQGRTAAGGQSQQRFARRRGNQAAAAAGKTTEHVVRLLAPVAGELAAVVTGGDRRTIDTVLADPRLASVRDRRAERHLEVPTPKHAALRDAVAAARAVTVHLPPA